MDDDLTAAEQLAAIGQAVITTDPAGVIVYWSASAERLYGWTAQETVGRNIADVTVPEVGQDVAAEIMAALRDGVPWSGGFPVRRKDGSTFPALVTDAGVYRDGELMGIVGVSTNLGSAIRPLLERSTDAALLLRHDAVVTYASPAVEMLFGWSSTPSSAPPSPTCSTTTTDPHWDTCWRTSSPTRDHTRRPRSACVRSTTGGGRRLPSPTCSTTPRCVEWCATCAPARPGSRWVAALRVRQRDRPPDAARHRALPGFPRGP